MVSKLTFILGGARSGKSSYVERLAIQSHQSVLYIATAQALDDEMKARITDHQQKRPTEWQTLELASGIGKHFLVKPPQAEVVILDCLTLLISNLLLKSASHVDHPDEYSASALVDSEVTDLLNAIRFAPAHWLVVSNEVGQGLVPPYPAGRIFRDLLGRVNQRFAQEADEVFWMVAGIPLPIGEYRK